MCWVREAQVVVSPGLSCTSSCHFSFYYAVSERKGNTIQGKKTPAEPITKQLRQHAGKNKTKKTWLDIVCSAPIHSSGPVQSPAKCKCKNLLTQNCFWWAIKTYFLFEPELPVYVLRCYNCIINSAPFWKFWTLSQPVRTLNWAYGECRLNKSEHVDKQPDHFWKTAWKAPVLMPPFRGYKQPCLLYQMGHALNRTVNPGLVILLTDLNIMD